MSIEFVTARRGAVHVDSDDVRAFNRVTLGNGLYILKGCECTVITANSVNVAAGEIMVDGGHIRITGQGETVGMDNGATSYKRHDLICLHYTRGSDDIESIEVVTVKGTPADANPQDPELPTNGSIEAGDSEAYYPIYRIPLDGLTVGEPVLLAEDMTPTHLLAESEYDLQVMLGTYPGRNLTEIFADEIVHHSDEAEWFNARVIAGNFKGIRPHDYFDITLSDGKVFRYRVGAIDPYLHAGDQEITKHHIIMVPDQVWPEEIHWNETNNNNGNATVKNPYLASNLHNWEINTFYPLLPQKWKNVMAENRILLEERYSDSGQLTSSNSWSWQNVGKIFSLSETEVYGFPVWSCLNNGYAVGFDCHFPIFKTTGNRIRRQPNGVRYDWWLRSVHGGSYESVCYGTGYGRAGSYVATAEWVRPLPCFRVGV